MYNNYCSSSIKSLLNTETIRLIMKKILILILIILVLGLVYLFFPKNAGGTCGFCPGPPQISRTEYSCIGIKYDMHPGPGCLDCGIDILCFGIVTSEKKCYTHIKGTPVEVPSCKTPSTWQEILGICPDCYSQASSAAYSQNDLSKAIEICGFLSPNEQKNCVLGIARLAIDKNDLDEAENICSNSLTSGKDTCLREIAEKKADSDIEAGVAACKKVDTTREQDNCYHNIAVKARQTNVTRALEICDMIKEDISTPPCKELIEKYCKLYGC